MLKIRSKYICLYILIYSRDAEGPGSGEEEEEDSTQQEELPKKLQEKLEVFRRHLA